MGIGQGAQALVLGTVIAGSLCAAPPAAAQPQGGTALAVRTQHFNGQTLVPLTLPGLLWGPAPDASKGVVVLVHGSGGLSDHPVGHYARAFAAAGFTAYAFDAFTPRGVTSTVEDQSTVSSVQMARDALNARRMLIGKGYAAQRFAVMGFSKGGSAALITADRTFLPDEQDRFAAALPWYPACNAQPRHPKPASKVFIGIGEKDDYVAIKPCEDLASAYRAAGGEIAMKVYAGAPHAFDGHPNNTRMFHLAAAQNFRDCVWIVEDDLQVTYGGTTTRDYAEFGRQLRATCMKKGASVWTDQRQKELATRDALEFVQKALAP